MSDEIARELAARLEREILVIDGAMGSLIQSMGFDEAAFRGLRFAEHGHELRGNNDLLCLTQPEAVFEIHRQYLMADADVVSTNSFTANRISQADYGLEAHCREINREAARIARTAVDEWNGGGGDDIRYVAGSMGPGNKTLSMGPRVEDPAFREVSFADVREAYAEQAAGLVEGGAHLLLLETIIDTLNAKAALVGIEQAFAELGRRVPVMISATVTDKSGRLLSGQTLEAFWISVAHARPFSLGLNCSFGASELRPFLADLAGFAPIWTSAHPNAGLPNAFGGYDETPERTAELLREFCASGLVNLVGGCCGTTPNHIRVVKQAVEGLPPRRLPDPGERRTRFAGLEPLTIRPDSNLIMVGERTNVAGSRRFARLVKAGDDEGTLDVARQQVMGGANMIDVNMDEALLDSVAAMERFLKLAGADPEIAALPVMIDSSRWEVIEAGLRCVQGKGVVNSLSLKDGEAEFLRRAAIVRAHGAGAVIMAFDETGQADTAARRVEILERAYRLLVDEAGFPPEDVVLDPNVLAVATGLDEHRDYAKSYLDALPELKRRCPGAKISGGISNLSFAFRGHDHVREAMHAAFLYHAIAAGLDMGIVNAGQLAVYEDIAPDLREAVEDVIFNRREDAAERLLELAQATRGETVREEAEAAWRQLPVEGRLADALVHGRLEHMEEDLAEALESEPEALKLIEGPLMDGMGKVGELFGAGKMFLPQVVKSARAMKRAVAILQPRLEEGVTGGKPRGTVLMATVKGDVHDIGKNIVGVVLGCNGFAVEDLGVMVPRDRILDAAAASGADAVGLSGLITPSLDEMEQVAREMERRGLDLPLLIGGATTSREHTAVKLAPAYSGPVIHVKDASRAATVLSNLLDGERRRELLRENAAMQEDLRGRHARRRDKPLLPLATARERGARIDWAREEPPRPVFTGTREVEIPIAELAEWIDWTFFFHAWELKGRYPRILEHPDHGAAARDLFADAKSTLAELAEGGELAARGVFGFWPAAADGDDILLYGDESRGEVLVRLNMLRQQKDKSTDRPSFCLADFVAPAGSGRRDWLGAFAVTAGLGAGELAAAHEAEGDQYRAIMVKALADRLAEAFAEKLHLDARRAWGIELQRDPKLEDLIRERYRGIRPAYGYPACPDHSEKFKLFDLLDAPARGITLTEQGAMLPAASVSGLYFSHRDARYFDLGRVGKDQARDYAARKGVPLGEVERWLASRLDYDPAD